MSTATHNALVFAALGHDVRLAIFHLLVKAGPDGMRVGDIKEHLDIAASTLAHHLSTLVDAELVIQEKQGREVYNKANYPTMMGVVNFLTSECCSGFDGNEKGGAC